MTGWANASIFRALTHPAPASDVSEGPLNVPVLAPQWWQGP